MRAKPDQSLESSAHLLLSLWDFSWFCFQAVTPFQSLVLNHWSESISISNNKYVILLSVYKWKSKHHFSFLVAVYTLFLLLFRWKCLNYTDKLHPCPSALNIKTDAFSVWSSNIFFTKERLLQKKCVLLCSSAVLYELLHTSISPSDLSTTLNLCLIMEVYNSYCISPTTALLLCKHNSEQKSPLMPTHTRPFRLSTVVNIALDELYTWNKRKI